MSFMTSTTQDSSLPMFVWASGFIFGIIIQSKLQTLSSFCPCPSRSSLVSFLGSVYYGRGYCSQIILSLWVIICDDGCWTYDDIAWNCAIGFFHPAVGRSRHFWLVGFHQLQIPAGYLLPSVSFFNVML